MDYDTCESFIQFCDDMMIANESSQGNRLSYQNRMKNAEKIGIRYLKVYQELYKRNDARESKILSLMNETTDKTKLSELNEEADKCYDIYEKEKEIKIKRPLENSGYIFGGFSTGSESGKLILGIRFKKQFDFPVLDASGEKTLSDSWSITTRDFEICDENDW